MRRRKRRRRRGRKKKENKEKKNNYMLKDPKEYFSHDIRKKKIRVDIF